MAVMKAISNNSYNLDGLEVAEREVIQRALSREPRQRYENCLAMVEALKAATTERPTRKSGGFFGNLFGRRS